jgi:hypothetical protein
MHRGSWMAKAPCVSTASTWLRSSTPRKNPHDPGRQQTTRSCLHVILNEEWEHLRYAVRDRPGIGAAGLAWG